MPAIPESTRDSITWRLLQHAGAHWPQLGTVQVRCRGSFAYITGVLPGGEQIQLCRLRYGGSAHSFGFAIYSAARGSYDDAVLRTGLHTGTPQEALDTACTVHLAGLGHEPADGPPANLRGYPLSETTSKIKEVRNYIRALEHGVQRIRVDDFPISLRLIKEMHRIWLTGVRGQDKTPGEFRRTQNWIQSPDNRPDTARFVPPSKDEMWDALDDWEKYCHDKHPRLPLLVRCALLHYQFETIHPFLDGNGRLGRLFIALYLMERGRLSAPLLYLSGYFDRRRDDYYDRLQYVRERGEISEWLLFFLEGVAVQAADAVERAERLSDLREKFRAQLRGTSARTVEAVDLLFATPILTVRYAQDQLGLSQPGATGLLRRLAAHGIVQELGVGPGVRHRWYSDEILRLLDPERA